MKKMICLFTVLFLSAIDGVAQEVKSRTQVPSTNIPGYEYPRLDSFTCRGTLSEK